MGSSVSSSRYDLTGNLIEKTYPRLVQVASGSGVATTPYLYDGRGNKVNGVKFQEAFERDSNNDLQPTTGSFVDMFWEEDLNGDKMPKDIKFWLDSDYNLVQLDAPS